MSRTLEDQLQALPLLGGLTATDLWPCTFMVVLGWMLLLFFAALETNSNPDPDTIPDAFHHLCAIYAFLDPLPREAR